MVFNFSINQSIQNKEVQDLAEEQSVNINRQCKSKSESDISWEVNNWKRFGLDESEEKSGY